LAVGLCLQPLLAIVFVTQLLGNQASARASLHPLQPLFDQEQIRKTHPATAAISSASLRLSSLINRPAMSPFEFHWPAISGTLQHPLPDPRLLLSLQNSPIRDGAAGSRRSSSGYEPHCSATVSFELTFKCELWPRARELQRFAAQVPPPPPPPHSSGPRRKLRRRTLDNVADCVLAAASAAPEIPTAMDNNSNGSPTKWRAWCSQQQRFSCENVDEVTTTSAGLLKHRESGSCGRGVAFSSRSGVRCSELRASQAVQLHPLAKICGKAFSRMWLLNGHIRTHTGEKAVRVAASASGAFADRSNLRAHMQTNSEGRHGAASLSIVTAAALLHRSWASAVAAIANGGGDCVHPGFVRLDRRGGRKTSCNIQARAQGGTET
uniref:C2H2-type domain-containing protein n=1 Tax=Macrostomum lignano TaxID=282301 RepID=A0A1I8JRQ1_9PLAT